MFKSQERQDDGGGGQRWQTLTLSSTPIFGRDKSGPYFCAVYQRERRSLERPYPDDGDCAW